MRLKISLIPASFSIENRDAALGKIADYLETYLQENGIEANIEIKEEVKLPTGLIKKLKHSTVITDDESALEFIEGLQIDGQKFAITQYKMSDEVSPKVIGISSPGRPALLISWESLGKENDLDKICIRAAKEIMHELGHNLGIIEHHTWGYECAMVETEDNLGNFSPENIDKKTYKFCQDCREKLKIPQQ
ncbi:TPA: hypothetical protein H1016_03655 [archaeon]|uniref:Archaemetzincin n=1 Tax=Candidatus Naiadarchaeum limnaeum TaxID=2756139 RepID=A0A832UVQ8_9ARCH|nr:hypothetical protein [Candidatus Naiadarchaeum limnaeum]